MARAILMEEGFGRLTIDAVVTRSGVSKPTIYRSWANATELAMAALISSPAPAAVVAGSARARLDAQVSTLVVSFATTRGRQIALTLASADPSSEYTKAFRTRVILESREAGRTILLDAIAAGELEPQAQLDVLLDMIYGPIFYRLLLGHLPIEPEFAVTLVDFAFRMLDSRSATDCRDQLGTA